MKKTKSSSIVFPLVIVVFLFLLPSQLFSAIHTSVPLNHVAYNIIEVAEIEGIIEKQIDTRPYSAHKVIRLLKEILEKENSLKSGEIKEVQSIINELNHLYGTTPSGADELFSTGFLRYYSEKTNIGTSIGVNIKTQQTSLLGTKEFDSRNSVTAFIKGDLGSSISFNMNFGLLLDRLNNRPFLDTEFTIPCDGFYMQLTQGGKGLNSLPAKEFYTGLAMHPEIAATFFDGALTLRWGGVARDWGVGMHNLLISKNARGFNGIEINVDVAPWLRYSVVTGSLTIFDLKDIDGKPFFSDELGDRPYYRFDNNISAHRVELDATKNLTISIYEAVVWKKRFELGYLNPVSIYMFEQNNLGDLDDVIAGVDFDLRIGKKVKVYGALAMSEMSSFKKVFTTPRNVLAYQGGIVIPLPIGNFSTFTFQATHLSPFFYAHYPFVEKTASVPSSGGTITTDRGNKIEITGSDLDDITINDEAAHVPTGSTTAYSSDGRIEVKKEASGEFTIYETFKEVAYVHKGESIGYPLHPNSTEFLAQLDVMLPKGYRSTVSATYQARSGQYGFDIEQFMIYSEDDQYPDKDFWNHIFNHKLTFKVEGGKKFMNMPIELSGSYRFTTEWKKDIESTTHDGRDTQFSDWKGPIFNHVVSVGARIFL